jgi:tetratricopeptide (TPR) repeat protein
LLNLSRENEALDAFAKTLDYDIDQKLEIKVLYAEGRAYENQKNINAINKFQQCIELIGDNKTNELYLSSYYHLALNQQRHKEYEHSIASFSKIIETDCNDKCVYEERGRSYLMN